MNNFGLKIKELRKKNGLTQSELAEKTFVSDKTISSWETNRTSPSFSDIELLSKVLKCTISYLLFENEDKGNVKSEIKIKVDDYEFNRVLNLIKNKSKLIEEVTEKDTYFRINDNSSKEWLRIREKDNKNILSYKKWHQNKFSDYYEVLFDNKDNLCKIFDLINLKPYVYVNKKRIRFIYNDEYEISFDDVESLGKFIEIKTINYDYSKALYEYDELIKLASNLKLNLDNISLKRYPEYFI